MRFLDVTHRQIDSFNNYATKTFVIDDVEAMLSMPMHKGAEAITKLLECPCMNEPVMYELELHNCADIDSFEIICDLATTAVINNNSRNQKERTDITNTIPEVLDEVNATWMPILYAINHENINGVYNLHIICGKKCPEKYEFYLISATPEVENE